MAKKTTKSKAKKNKGEDDEEESGTNSAVLNALETLDDEGWSETEETSFDEVPKGNYQVQVNKAKVGPAKSSGELQIAWEMTIVTGGKAVKGRKLWAYSGLGDEVKRGRTRGDLAKLGIKWPKSAKLLPELLQDKIVGGYAEVRVKPKKDGDGVWVNFVKALEEEDISGDEEEEELESLDTEDEDEAEVEEDEEEEEEEEKPSKSKKSKKSKQDDDDEDEEDEDEDEDEAPKSKKSKKSKDDDEDEEDDEAESDEDEDEDDEDEDDEDEKPKSKKSKKDEDGDEDEDEDEEAEGVNIEFTDDDLEDETSGKIKKLAKSLDFKASDYDSIADLLADLAEDVGLSGTFSDPDKLLIKVQKAAKNK